MKKKLIIFLIVLFAYLSLNGNTTKKYEKYDSIATHYLLNALMFEEFTDFERAIINYETAYNQSNSSTFLINKAVDEYYLGNDENALKIFEDIDDMPKHLLKYRYYQYIMSSSVRNENISKEALNDLIKLYSEKDSKSKIKEGMFLLEKLLSNYKKYNKASYFELFLKNALLRDISQVHREFFSAVLFKFYSSVEVNNEKVINYVDSLLENYKESDYNQLVFVYDELIATKRLELAEKVHDVLNKVRYLDPEYYIFSYTMEKAKGNSKKTRKIISSAQDSYPGVYFELMSLQQFVNDKEFKNANIVYNNLVAEHPEDKNIYYRYIMSLIENDQIDKAIEIYETAINKFPEEISMRNNYAYLLVEHNKDIEKALELSNYAVEKEPENISFLDTLAWIYFIKGDYINAEIYIDKAFDQSGVLADPNSMELFDHYKKIKTKLIKYDDIQKIKINELTIALNECITSAMNLLK
ncbi:MAG: tetratricopeptide repeat protein [Candidatus Delongbacteria bacterium]|nr:tetratricopeptide repeat protein [Candidatus Delongbacteria bacterium]